MNAPTTDFATERKKLKDQLFHWPTVVRLILWGAIPLAGLFWLAERLWGEDRLGVLVLILAATLPFMAVGWLAYQHYRHRRS